MLAHKWTMYDKGILLKVITINIKRIYINIVIDTILSNMLLYVYNTHYILDKEYYS